MDNAMEEVFRFASSQSWRFHPRQESLEDTAIPVEEITWAEIHGFLLNVRGQYEQHWSRSDLWLGFVGVSEMKLATHLVLGPALSFVSYSLLLQLYDMDELYLCITIYNTATGQCREFNTRPELTQGPQSIP
ncbi:hypothetical protein HGM15179_016429 [Zosterops borbonicus]|uniref:Uncharacterized protein n=1 Tax=Zosterops borbonicus TaxID=364589 RepID=A0A8K1G2U5_9PASS|nr:hypothetical protein HGM15179_016429 [Zosterops borbonicus]